MHVDAVRAAGGRGGRARGATPGRPRPLEHVYPRDTGWLVVAADPQHAVAVDGHDDAARRRADPAVGEDVLAARPHGSGGAPSEWCCMVAVTTTLDWYGCATFRLRTAGLTIFLDAYIDRAPVAAGTGLTADDVDACDWIVIGHSHFDHVWGAERIVANTDARVIASYETVRILEHAGVPIDRMVCVAGGERVDLGSGVFVRVYPSLHSCVWSQTKMTQSGEVCLGDLGVTYQEREQRMRGLGQYLATALDPVATEHLLAGAGGHSDRGDGGALLFLFETPDGTVLFQDTSGHWGGVLDGVDARRRDPRRRGPGQRRRRAGAGLARRLRRRPGRDPRRAPGGARPSRRLAARLLGAHRHGADPRRVRRARRPGASCSSPATSRRHRSSRGSR